MGMNWRKSTRSGNTGGQCVEVASTSAVLIRDTTDRGGFTLSVPVGAWAAFTSGIK